MEIAAREKAKQILKDHHPEPLPKDVLIQGDAFVKEVMRSYGH
jgi:hypothetical protein